ncbi:hypothetical protein ASD15_12990 [Massilia sp. Root351]|uniref:hypothetical protein n=1 Tax=Massilia sp. Root351 TaxID=1736522 RepID=UPI000710AE3C|nr:hypothetical protein [Massilia sp. Root351]KQV80820.1 hypothetical protein ASD15_12990 [Massilia sp. Root351]
MPPPIAKVPRLAAARRPPPPPDRGGFVNAIASALESLGLAAGDGAGSTASTNTGASGAAAGSGNAAQALGSFLHELMGALHEQGASAEASATSGESQVYGPQGGAGGPSGPGKLEADLQSLIAKLGSSSETDSSGSTDGAGDAGSALETSFQSLLDAFGGDTADASGKLASFLQALSDKLSDAGASGNLINTTV